MIAILERFLYEMNPRLFYLFPLDNYLDLRPYQSGYEDNAPSSSFGPATRNHYLFHYVISGTGVLTADDENGISHRFQIHTGEGFLIFPNQLTLYYADAVHPWEYTWIEFDGVFAADIVNRAGLTYENPIYRSVDKMLTEEMKDAMLAMCHPLKETTFYKISKLYQFADCFIRSSASARQQLPNGSISEYYLEKAFAYIEHNFMNPISVESIAKHCHIHRNQLLKIFRNALDKSPQEYLITYRMSKASWLLTTTKLSINEIGNAVGYPNQLHFSRAFKNVYHLSPKQYREHAAEK